MSTTRKVCTSLAFIATLYGAVGYSQEMASDFKQVRKEIPKESVVRRQVMLQGGSSGGVLGTPYFGSSGGSSGDTILNSSSSVWVLDPACWDARFDREPFRFAP
jgi:hypothetical protein